MPKKRVHYFFLQKAQVVVSIYFFTFDVICWFFFKQKYAKVECQNFSFSLGDDKVVHNASILVGEQGEATLGGGGRREKKVIIIQGVPTKADDPKLVVQIEFPSVHRYFLLMY